MGITPSRGEGAADSRGLQPLTCGYHTIYTNMCSCFYSVGFGCAIWDSQREGGGPKTASRWSYVAYASLASSRYITWKAPFAAGSDAWRAL